MGWWTRLFGLSDPTDSGTSSSSDRMRRHPTDDYAKTADGLSGSRLDRITQLHLVTAIRGDDPEVRRAAAQALSGSVSDGSAQLHLVSAIRDNDPEVRQAAARALSGSPLDRSAQLHLVSAVNDGDPAIRAAAAQALGR